MNAPRLLYADEEGNIFDHPEMAMCGSAGGKWEKVEAEDCIPLPEGSELFLLPQRLPVGVNSKGRITPVEYNPDEPEERVTAVAAFMAPAHTATLWAAYKTVGNAPNLPLFAYAAVGFHEGQFVVTGLRVDPLPRQDPGRFPTPDRLQAAARRLLRQYKNNRLWQHLGTCAMTYGCPAAKNLVLGRWEAPLPTSPVCNADCIGCLSYQPSGTFPCTQERIDFAPLPEEVAEVALHHFGQKRDPLVSFGQGCEGEPLMQADLLARSIRQIRQKEPNGTINLNTNGSRPDQVRRLMGAGLSSIRVSLNSLIPERHATYYRPKGWSLDQAIESLREVKKAGGFASINLLTMPGLTDREEEVEALVRIIEDVRLDLIQWRNINIDPEIYLRALEIDPDGKRVGIAQLIERLRKDYPSLRHGYFNPKLD